MPDRTVSRIHPPTSAPWHPRASVVLPTFGVHADLDEVIVVDSHSVDDTIDGSDGKGRNVEIVRTEPRDVAPVIALPVRMHGNRVIQPLDVPAGTLLGEVGHDGDSSDHGPLARALMALGEAGTR